MSTKGAGSKRRGRAANKRLRERLGPLDPGEDAPCHYCRAPTVVLLTTQQRGAPWPANMRTRDHVVPKAAGGPDKPWNIVLACRACNEARQDRGGSCWCAFCAAAWERHRRRLVVAS